MKFVSIQSNGKELSNIPLSDQMIGKLLNLKQNSEGMLSEIQDGEVKIIEASCPDQVCVKR